MNWGSSSRLYRRIHLPGLVTRGSSFILKSTPPSDSLAASRAALRSSASVYMERNLSILNRVPSIPTRSCAKNAGPPSCALTRMPSTSITGKSRISAVSEPAMSMHRFTIFLARVNRGVATWIRGSPASCWVWMRGPATSVRPVFMTRRMRSSARAQPRWRISVVLSGTAAAITRVSTSCSRQALMIPCTLGRSSDASAFSGRRTDARESGSLWCDVGM